MKQVLRDDGLNATEIGAFRALCRWGQETLLKVAREKKLQHNEHGLRVVLEGLLPHIRFPIMSLEEFALEVRSSNSH